MAKLHLASAADDSYFIGALVLFHSVISNMEDVAVFHFAYNVETTTEANMSFLEDLFSTLNHELRAYPLSFSDLPSKRHISQTTFSKFFFLENLQKSFLWIDSDAIALKSLASIGVQISSASERGLIVARRRAGNQKDFNAGVFLAIGPSSIPDWRTHLDARRSSLEQHIFQSEAKVVGWLPSEWNWTVARTAQRVPTAEAAPVRIMHFTGPVKPWHLHPDLWVHCLSEGCEWAGWFQTYLEFEGKLSLDKVDQVRKILRQSRTSIHKHRSTLAFRIMTRLMRSPALPAILSLRSRKNNSWRRDLHPFH